MAASLLAWALAWATPAGAEPVLRLIEPGRGVLTGGKPGQRAVIALTGEATALGVLGAERLTTLPDIDTIAGNEPELALARVGVLGRLEKVPLSGLVRVDFSEGMRVDNDDVSERFIAVLDRFVDDAAVWWEPRVWASMMVGRGKVPFSRFRQLDRALLTSGTVPFLVDHIAPDRRWGATVLGDLGALGYAAGIYADTMRLEMRRGDEDPSKDGRALLAAHVEWTPRAPIGSDHVATAVADPWFDTVRVSLGAGVLARLRGDDAGGRTDASVSSHVSWTRYSVLAEAILSADAGTVSLSAAGQASVLVSDKVVVFARGDVDAVPELWSAGGGASYFATSDRRNKVTFFGWARREADRGPRRDGAVVQLQAAF